MSQVIDKKCKHRECGSNVDGWCQIEGLRPTFCMQAVEKLTQKDKQSVVRISRSEIAGIVLADAIIEMVHLMYQRNTAKRFMRGLMQKLNSANHW